MNTMGAFHYTEFSKIMVGKQMEYVNFWEKLPKIWDNFWACPESGNTENFEYIVFHLKNLLVPVPNCVHDLAQRWKIIGPIPFGQWKYQKLKPVFFYWNGKCPSRSIYKSIIPQANPRPRSFDFFGKFSIKYPTHSALFMASVYITASWNHHNTQNLYDCI